MKLKIEQKRLIEKTSYIQQIKKYDFQQYETIISFGESIYTCKVKIVEAEEDQRNLLENILEFDNKSRPKTKEGKSRKEILMKVHMLFVKVKN